jgi:DNA-binding CsgD family transcriptional regulator
MAAMLYNGLGRYRAREAARQAAADPSGLHISTWVLSELIEAAVRSGDMPMAGDAVARLAETTQAGGADFGLGIEARSRALVTEDGTADDLYREAIDRLGRTQFRPELARAHLLYGEWLRRQGHRAQARDQLRTAQAAVDASKALTAQEAQVAQLARDGLSNPEIGARLFISSHTVQYHLGKVFTKLGVTSRGQLHRVLPGG